MEMRQYEAVTIYPPDLTPDRIEQVRQEFKGLVEKHSGKFLNHQELGKRALGCSIRKHTQGVYLVYHFDLDTQQVTPLKKAIRLSDQILRASVVLHDFKVKSTPAAGSQTHPVAAASSGNSPARKG